MRALLINPNMTQAITARMAALVRPHLPEDCEILEATGRFGAPYITTPAQYEAGGRAALDALARHAGFWPDVVMLACFGDPALEALRAASPAPVVGMASAACALAARQARRFSIVTGGAAWKPMLETFVASIGLAGQLASVRTTTLTGGQIAADPEAALVAMQAQIEACLEDGAEIVILGGAGLAGLDRPLRDRVRAPLIDSTVAMAEAAALALR